ncbi:homocysteine-responsive endoplasmic reticulum-resident ubiquitin-like domain member 2 protein isoform X4 [Tupaia chinensis]|uniref:homocysteine-responsive endoplasmic reticulum-resident ubiquitin-like domain member 2 protein isoform X4 n=1 Tax=Tupaia chinensis TaxID=246437 RepID=UPI000FFB3DCE|nr:homocysteine-responsive endoplasmic reticulum-resident ubiquitin-like domain member 2 protein isoform X4 [Tupaia chinensis]
MERSGVDMPVTLIIKAPNQKYSDQTVSCFLNWTVGTLKTHLSNVYPSRPLTKDQRLVYSGRLLPDHLQLKDILRKQDEYHMVHLVCASRTPPSSPRAGAGAGVDGEGRQASASGSSPSSDHSGPTMPSSSQEALSSAAASSSEGLRQRALPPAQADPAQRHLLPYATQGQAAVSAQATPNAGPAQPAASQPLNLAHVPGEEAAAAPDLAAQEDRPVNEDVPMNAQGGPVLDEDWNRDWLDWLYTLSRAAVLLGIMYFYSSFSRFVVVMGAMLLLYLHQAGWFPFRQEGGPQQAPHNAEGDDGQNARNLELEEMERLMDNGLEDETGEDARAAPGPGLMAAAWSFVTTFFTSLIPEGPPQAAN